MTDSSKADGHTPLMRQYLDVKSRHRDALLFFRVGDFYEMFFGDAEEGSALLGLTLTSRNNGGAADVPLAGVPVKAADEYISRLLDAGRRVAICEQLEDASEADGIVRRDVVEVITPGTVLEESRLSSRRNNYVVAVAGEGPFGVAAVDLSTGEFRLAGADRTALADELARIEPAEVLQPASGPSLSGPWVCTRRPAWRFDPELGHDRLTERFATAGVEGFGIDPRADSLLLAAAAALLAYLEEVRPSGVEHLRPPRVERGGEVMYLDEMTRRNLELVEPIRRGRGSTVLECIDVTRTAMGARLMRRRLLRPLLDRARIERRLDAVGALIEAREAHAALHESLGRVRDLERLAARVSAGRAGPRDLLGLGTSLEALPKVRASVEDVACPTLQAVREQLDPLDDVRAMIGGALDPDAPATLAEGGVIRPGYDPELDELRGHRDGAVDWIAGMQVRERERTGIDNLKVGYNRVFGYYLEVTRSRLDRVPDDYTRKQTLTGAERFVTPELKQWESKVVDADEAIAVRELELFQALRSKVAGHVSRLQQTARAVAELDVHAALAQVATRWRYVRPELVDDAVLEVTAGRHPVVERAVGERFIPNDVVLDHRQRVIVLTGPNMSGKSTVLRQVGLIALMAQMGSFVPAERVRMGVCDRVFTRVGASDNLADGQSTFMVEMTETATILNSATDRSLVLLDEIGRGTSTFDGVSIAWAVTEALHEVESRTVFATHYHELVALAERLPGAAPFNVAVRESGQTIAFLHRLEPGGSDRSYGVQVARLAGLPPPVVDRAGEILHALENGPAGAGGRAAALTEAGQDQLGLWPSGERTPPVSDSRSTSGSDSGPPERAAAARDLLDALRAVDPDRLTPLEALHLVAGWRDRFDGPEPQETGGPGSLA